MDLCELITFYWTFWSAAPTFYSYSIDMGHLWWNLDWPCTSYCVRMKKNISRLCHGGTQKIVSIAAAIRTAYAPPADTELICFSFMSVEGRNGHSLLHFYLSLTAFILFQVIKEILLLTFCYKGGCQCVPSHYSYSL